MSSSGPYRTPPFQRNQRLTAAHLETVRDGTAGNIQLRNPDNFVKRYPGGHILTNKKRSKGGGGGANPYIIITVVTNRNDYTGNVIDPVTLAVITAGVTIKAPEPTAGGSMSVGDKLFVASVVDDIYYIQPPVVKGS